MKGIKHDKDKVRTDLIEPDFIIEVAKVLTHGANTYGDWNWSQLENGIDRYYAALLRHILSWRNGEVYDKETGLHHLSHAATNLMFIQYLEDKE